MATPSGAAGKQLFTVAVGDPEQLAALLAARMGIALEEAERLIARGAVQLSGARATGPEALRPGLRVVVRTPRDPPSPPSVTRAHPPTRAAPGSGASPGPLVDLLLVDEDLIACDKPAGLLAQPSPGELDCLEARVQHRFPEARLAHRLDRDTSGVALFTRTRRAHAAMQHAFATGAVERVYLALCAGRLEPEQVIRLRIAPDPQAPGRRRALPEHASSGQPATTRVRPLAAAQHDGQSATRIEARLDTGRTHQIRVHLAAIGHPLVGDRLYGGPAAPRLLLHAVRLAFRHPRDGRAVELNSPVPQSFST